MSTPPTLIYDGRLAQVWHGDARDVLATIATESVDLVVTDPPYGVAWRSNRRAERFAQLAGDEPTAREAIREVLRDCVRVVGQNRHLYVFGPSDVLDGLKVSAATEIVWDKGTLGTGNLASSWSPAHEVVSFVTSKHRHAGEAGRENLPVRLRKGSVLRFPRPTGRKVRHPSEKPVPLLRELVESSSRQGETVLDVYAGVGSTGVASILSGRRTILAEIDEGFARVAAGRVAAAELLTAEAGRL